MDFKEKLVQIERMSMSNVSAVDTIINEFRALVMTIPTEFPSWQSTEFNQGAKAFRELLLNKLQSK